MRMITIK